MNDLICRNNNVSYCPLPTKIGIGKLSTNIFATMVLCFFTLFNLNKTSAALRFIAIPLFICFALSILPFFGAKKNIKKYAAIFAFGLVAVLSTLISDVVLWSASASSLVIFIFLFFIITVPNNNGREIKMLLKFYSRMILIVSLIILVNYLFDYSLNDGRVSITFLDVRKDENYLSAFLSFGFAYYLLSFFCIKTKKLLHIISALIVFVAVFLTGSRAALISMVISLLLILINEFTNKEKNNGTKIIVLLVSFFLFLFLYLCLQGNILFSRMTDAEGFSTNIRLRIWSYAIEAFTRKPFIGSGIQSGTYFAQQSLRWYTHSCFVDLITSVGILGAFLFLIVIFDFVRVKKGNRLCMLTIILSMFVPLFFINGFECATFWFPMILCKLISKSLKTNSFKEILL